MRIEVLISDENPVFHDLRKPKMVLGSDVSCDIIIMHPDVSRQHLILINEGENFFIMDRGSTNGSYLNEERLIPGRRVEFNSFFPIRLGTQVLISLVSDEEGSGESITTKISIPIPGAAARNQSNSDATRVISLKDLKAAKTETLTKKRTEIKKKVEAEKGSIKKKKSSGGIFNATNFMVLAIMGIAIYLNNPFKAKPVVDKTPIKKTDANGAVDRKVIKIVKATGKDRSKGISVRGLFSVNAPMPKCGTDLEKLACPLLDYSAAPYGVKETETDLIVYVQEGKYLVEAVKLLQFHKENFGQKQEISGFSPPAMNAAPSGNNGPSVPPPTPVGPPPSIDVAPMPQPTNQIDMNANKPKDVPVEIVYDTTIPDDFDQKDVYRIALALFLAEVTSKDVRLNKIKKDLLIGLVKKTESGSLVVMAATEIAPARLEGLKFILDARRISAVKEQGAKVIYFTEEHYPYFFGSELD